MVAGVVVGGAECFGVGCGRVESEKFRRVGAVLDVGLDVEAVGRRDCDGNIFVGYPAAEDGDVGLPPVGVDMIERVRQEVAIDDGAEVRRRVASLVHCGLEDLIGGELAEIEELVGAIGSFGPDGVALLYLCQREHGTARACEFRAALADGLGEEARCEGRSHLVAD